MKATTFGAVEEVVVVVVIVGGKLQGFLWRREKIKSLGAKKSKGRSSLVHNRK